MTAQLSSVSQEGTAVFQFGDGQIELELGGTDDRWRVGCWYDLTLQELRIVDMNL